MFGNTAFSLEALPEKSNYTEHSGLLLQLRQEDLRACMNCRVEEEDF